MVIEEFQRIAKKYDGKLIIDNKKAIYLNGARDFYYSIFLSINHKGRGIKTKITTQFPVGNFICNLENKRDSLEFNMETRDLFISLFLKGNRFKLKKASPNIKSFFRKSSGFKKITRISKETAFEPTIIGENIEHNYHLKFQFSLKFENWVQVIEPVIIFYKEFIDEFDN